MSFLRRSRDAKTASNISTPLSANGNPTIISKPASAKTFIPDKVVRAVEPHRATAPQELSFSKGDFFYVIRDLEFRGTMYYEVNNPNVGSRGIVPIEKVEVLSKQALTPKTASFAAPGTPGFGGAPPMPRSATGGPKHLAFFAIVQYDFSAERPDELDAKAGEAISVVAQSNREWFVAKPIGRLGGPGLIPVSFVELREPQTGRKMTEDEVNECMDKGTLPKVETWKKATLDYKQSSIPLGVIETAPSPVSPPPLSAKGNGNFASKQDEYAATNGNGYDPYGADDSLDEEELLPLGIPIQATIPSFHQESGEYWFRVDVRWQPDPDPDDPNYDPDDYPPQIAMVLYRNYEDFYAFQLAFLDFWPIEAGRQKREPNGPELTADDRILPFMPGPVDIVNEAVTVERRGELNQYVQDLVNIGIERGAEYVLRCELVRRFFSQKPGDVILPAPPPSSNPPSTRRATRETDQLRRLDQLSIHESVADPRLSRASAYSDHRSHRSQQSYGGNANGNHKTRASVSSYDGASQTQISPTNSTAPYSYSIPGHVRSPTASSDALTHVTSTDAGTGGAANQNSQFLKVKIFHSTTDDLIAIRVSPRITHNQLLEKVRDRLGSDIMELRYSAKTGMTTIHDEEDLRDWVSGNEKLVLYAY